MGKSRIFGRDPRLQVVCGEGEIARLVCLGGCVCLRIAAAN